jgi:site-specific recombinase XerD
LALASRTGLSSSDILSITQTNIFNENNHTYIHFEPKNDFKKDIYLELPDDVATLMEQYVKGLNLLEKNECIFKNSAGAAMSLQNLDNTLKKLFKKCGLEKYTLKDFRNRAVLEMAKMGASKEEISEYTGLSYLRVDSFIKNKELIKDNCPANLVNYRLIV